MRPCATASVRYGDCSVSATCRRPCRRALQHDLGTNATRSIPESLPKTIYVYILRFRGPVSASGKRLYVANTILDHCD